MKKMSVCISHLCQSVASVTLLCISLYFSVTVRAQLEKQDSTFKKWEVSFDLKPLFRSDQPYNVFIARNLTEKTSIRLGLSVADWGNTRDTSFFNQLTYIDTVLANAGGQSRLKMISHFNLAIKVGLKYELKKGIVSIYGASDLGLQLQHYNFDAGGGSGAAGIGADTITLQGFQALTYLRTQTTQVNLIQSLGLKYKINQNLSFSIETSLRFGLSESSYSSGMQPFDNPYKGGVTTILTTLVSNTGSQRNFSIEMLPFAGLYLNYHF